MIDFDRKTLAILQCIKRSRNKGVSWGALQKRYGEDAANPLLLEVMSKELYTVTKDVNGEWINFENWDRVSDYRFRSYSTPKGNELIERRCFDFWKWVIPTVISVVALVVSFIGVLRKPPQPQQTVPQPQVQEQQYASPGQCDVPAPASAEIQSQP